MYLKEYVRFQGSSIKVEFGTGSITAIEGGSVNLKIKLY